MPPKSNHDQPLKTSPADKGHELVAQGLAIVERARVDYKILNQHHTDGPLMRAWLRAAFPVRRRLLDLPPVEVHLSMAEMIEHILEAERIGHRHTANLGLVTLRRTYDAFDPAELPEDVNTWEKFAAKRIPFSAERIAKGIGDMVHRNGLMFCIGCGMIARRPCPCPEAYASEHVWASPVAETVVPATENATENRGRGRPPSDAAMTSTERSRKRRERQRNSAPPPAPDEEPANLLALQESHPDALSPEQRWEWSLGLVAGDAVAMAAHFDRLFPGWRAFEQPPEIRSLIDQAITAFQALKNPPP